jgi:hypothetical protein
MFEMVLSISYSLSCLFFLLMKGVVEVFCFLFFCVFLFFCFLLRNSKND